MSMHNLRSHSLSSFYDPAGGGDLSLGGRRALMNPAAVCCTLLLFCGCGASIENSDVVGEGSRGVPAADSARCTAAAEGTPAEVGFDALGGRWGLNS